MDAFLNNTKILVASSVDVPFSVWLRPITSWSSS